MDSDDTENMMSKKYRRKMDKKENKYKHLITQLPGILHSSEPTKFLMICNAGLVNGFDEGQAVQMFSKYGQLASVSMLPGKSFCFVTFSEAADAQNAYENMNGKLKLMKMLGPIYMIYTTSAPKSVSECLGRRPKGLFVLKDFITEEDERQLVNCISFSETTHSGNPTLLKNRRVKHYGYEFQYSNNNVNKEEKLPEDLPNECNILKEKLKNHGWDNLKWPPDQLTVNEYQPGQGIPPHIDTHSAFESPIMSLSLLSDIVMEFRHADGTHFPLHLPRRSLLIMDEEARYDWTHTIKPRKMDIIYGSGPIVIERGVRISFTFRWLRQGSCKCIYRDQCDSQAAEPTSTLDCDASRLETQHVHQVYNEISSHFSQTRYRAWPNVAEFVTSLPYGSVLFDVGCGNGKYFGLNHNIFEIGGDRSDGLLGECSKRGFEAVQCDCLQLPLRSQSVDGLICIAVIHHLSTDERRVEAIREMARVLRRGGRGLVYVWAKDQQRNNVPSKYLKQEDGFKSNADEGDGRNKGNCCVKGKKHSRIELDMGDGRDISSCNKECREGSNVESVLEDMKISDLKSRESSKPKLDQEDMSCIERGASFLEDTGCINKDKEITGSKSDERNKTNIITCELDEDVLNSSCNVGSRDLMSVNRESFGENVDFCEENSKTMIVNQNSRNINSSDGGNSCENSREVEKSCRNTCGISKLSSPKSEFSLPVHNNRTQFKHNDILVPWTFKSKTYYRYYHVFKEGELAELCSLISEIKVEKVYYDQGNWCAIFKKCNE